MKNYWWGYKLKNGEIKSRRYFGQDDITEAEQSPFVEDVYGEFECDTKEDADRILKKAFELRKQI